jgi:hypothetical protein
VKGISSGGGERCMLQNNLGACFEIKVDGKCRTYRALKETAIEAWEIFEGNAAAKRGEHSRCSG